MRRLRFWLRPKLPFLAASIMLWLMLPNIMGASASFLDSSQSNVGIAAFTSSKWTQTTQADFSMDARSNVDIEKQPGDVILKGSTDYLYAFQGGNTRTFWRYYANGSTTLPWLNLANTPVPLKDEGGALASDNIRYIYAVNGGTRQFWRYDTISNSWATLAQTPENVKLGGGLSYDGNGGFYALRGDSKNGFWRYSVASNAWTVKANSPGSVSDGGCLVSDQRSYLYALQGGGLTAFWRYDMSANTWTAMSSAPYPVRYGGAMVYDGQDSIYMLPGWSQTYFLRYSISEDVWYTLINIPNPVSYGGSIALSYPGLLYAFCGGGTSRFWKFDIALGAWHMEISPPGNVAAGGAMVGGFMVFPTSGTLTSTTLDTGVPGTTIQGLFWNESMPAGTDITFEMRASDHLLAGAPDGLWVPLGGSSPVTSGLPSGRYIQWRATLTTSSTHLTPALQEVRVYYA